MAANAEHLFDVPPGVTYLNSASLGPPLRAALEAGQSGVDHASAPWDIHAPDWFTYPEKLRELFAPLIGGDAEGVAIIPAVSYGIAVAASNIPLRPGQHVLFLDREYPSALYAWRRKAHEAGAEVRMVDRGDGTWTEALVRAIDHNTAVVATPRSHWTDGRAIDLEAVSNKAREVGAALVVDASQAVGAIPLDVKRIQPDFLVSVGYKWLLGPYGLAYLYAAPHRREGLPIEESWVTRRGAEDFARLTEYTDERRPGARRYDVGESAHFILGPMAAAALTQMKAWTAEGIQEAVRPLTLHAEEEALKMGLQPVRSGDRVGHIVGIRLPGGLPSHVGSALIDKGVYVGIRGDAIRIAPHMHSTHTDIDRLFQALREVL